MIHIDWMIGSEKVNVSGKDRDGNMVPIFKQGEYYGTILDPNIISSNIGSTASTAYESTHGYSDQYIVNLECFLKLAQQAGLESEKEYQLKFPNSELSNISINLFK